MNTTTGWSDGARRRTSLIAGLGPAVAAAVLLSAAPAPASPNIARDQIALGHTSRDLLPLRPRPSGDDTQTAEDAWAPVPGGPGTGGRFSDSTIQSECNLAGAVTCAP